MPTSSRKITLLATDQQSSVLNVLVDDRHYPIAYTPYGHRPPENGLLSLLGFNGEQPDPLTGHYHLGKGYRQFNPVLMRFTRPDSWSPFGGGGLNAYVYCGGDPLNRVDPTGHKWGLKKWFNRVIGRKPKVKKPAAADSVVTTTSTQHKSSDNISSPGSAKPQSVNESGPSNLMRNDSIDPSMRRRLNELKSKPADSPAPPTRTIASETPDASDFSYSAEAMTTADLNNTRRQIDAWPSGGERSRMLRTIDNEQTLRRLNVWGAPAKSNRSIRQGEPGYSNN
ncbi:RHS repeat-associated core domain-containing protein [Pseudomonas violetae]|jgi:RHS repeat-associated protein|uniref:RHS repeat-associated core domain-containing protein n=1 Tax=Pseudomonas violetae TaxID=2915813 RepID=UPI003D116C4E